jgi:hypothetical protein
VFFDNVSVFLFVLSFKRLLSKTEIGASILIIESMNAEVGSINLKI